MTHAIDAFFNCVSKTIVEKTLSEDGEYNVRTAHQNAELKRLNTVFDESVQTNIENLLVEQLAIGELREYAYFRAGFQLALELACEL